MKEGYRVGIRGSVSTFFGFVGQRCGIILASVIAVDSKALPMESGFSHLGGENLERFGCANVLSNLSHYTATEIVSHLSLNINEFFTTLPCLGTNVPKVHVFDVRSVWRSRDVESAAR